VADIPFLHTHDFQYGVIEPVSEGVRRLTARNPGPFTFHGTGTYIVGEGEVAVIDPGPDDPGHVQALLDGLAEETISHIIVTHCHQDHSPAARPLQAATGAKTYAFGPHGHTGDEQAVPVEEGIDLAFSPDISVKDGDSISGRNWELCCVHTPGHTSNHMCFSWEQHDLLFSGDHVMAWSTTVIIPPDGNMTDYLASLEKLHKRSDACLWPTHGPPVTDPTLYISALIEHRLARIKAIRELLRPGSQRINDMVPSLYPDIQPALRTAAGLSTLASLEHLQRLGEVTAQEDTGRGVFFSYTG